MTWFSITGQMKGRARVSWAATVVTSFLALVVGTGAAAPGVSANSARPPWTMHVLPTPAGVTGAWPTDVNDRGVIVGAASKEDGNSRAVVWRHGRVRVLPDGGAADSYAVAINNRGLIVGAADAQPVMWWRGRMRVLRHPARELSVPVDVNNRGVVVGTTPATEFTSTAYLYRHGRLRVLPASSWAYVYPEAINDRGDILASNDVDVFVWRAGELRRLRWLETTEFSDPRNLNDRGVVVGSMDLGPTWALPVVWRQGKPSLLPYPGSDQFPVLGRVEAGWANDVNNRGTIVGALDYWEPGYSSTRATVWRRGAFEHLPGSKTSSHAWNVNEHDWIVGSSNDDPVVWVPAP